MRLHKLVLAGVPAALGILCSGLASGQIRSPLQAPSAQAQPMPGAVPVVPMAADSPRAALTAYFDAARAGRWQVAARYLALTPEQQSRGTDLAERLKGVFDRNWVDLETVSGESGGEPDGDLPAEIDEVARIRLTDGQTEPVRMVKLSDASGAFWAFSPATVARIDDWYAALPNRWLRDAIVGAGLDPLLRPGPFELLWWQWLALPFLWLVAWASGRVLYTLTRRALRPALLKDGWGLRFAESVGYPLRLIWAIFIFTAGVALMAVTRPAYRFIDSIASAAVVFAAFWALWRSMRVLTDWVLHLSWAAQSASSRSLVTVGANIARGAIFVAGVLAVLSQFGYPVGTLLAGLGIGGLAVAFGAQKTVICSARWRLLWTSPFASATLSR